MTKQEAQQLKPGTLLSVRECMFDADSNMTLRDVVAKDGYIYKFVSYLENAVVFPIKTTSLATGKYMEFYLSEVEAVKEQAA